MYLYRVAYKKRLTTKGTKESQKQLYFTKKNTKKWKYKKHLKSNIKNQRFLCVLNIDFSGM